MYAKLKGSTPKSEFISELRPSPFFFQLNDKNLIKIKFFSTIRIKIRQMFRADAPSLESYIQSNKAFSLELVHGINGQRRPLTQDILEAHDSQRVEELQKYIDHFDLKDGEILTLLSKEEKSLDETQVGWVKKALHEVISNSTQINEATRDQISFGLVAKRQGVDLETGELDFEKIKDDKIAKSVFNLSKNTIHHEAVSILVNEVTSIAKLPEDDPKRKYNPRKSKIEAVLAATNEDTFESLFLKLYKMNHFVIGTESEMIPEKFILEKDKLDDAMLGMPILRDSLDEALKDNVQISAPSVSLGSLETPESIQGCISTKGFNDSLNYTPNIDLAAESKKLTEALGVKISTEHSMFPVFNSKLNDFQERFGGEFKSESSQGTNVGVIKNLKSKVKSTIKRLSSKGEEGGETKKIDWSSSDYNWHKKEGHFETENDKPIKSITFSDKDNNPIFIHKPCSGIGVGKLRFGNSGGTILFAKGRKITQDEASLMVAQFLRTNTTGQMYITPPKHLESGSASLRHVELLVIAALEYGVPAENINVRPNGMVSANQFQEMLERVTMNIKAAAFDEFGGLSETSDITVDAPKEQIVLEAKSEDVIIQTTKNKP